MAEVPTLPTTLDPVSGMRAHPSASGIDALLGLEECVFRLKGDGCRDTSLKLVTSLGSVEFLSPA
jgi:hypothetical protein